MKIIVNPKAGKGKGKEVLPQIERYFQEKKINFSITLSSYPSESTELAKKALKEGFKKIIVVGGDGTVNEVVNGVAGSEDIVLGIIPVGSGNDFSFSLGIPLNIREACDVVLNGKIKKIDLAKINERFFVSSAGIGLDAETAYEANKNPNLTGLFLYLFSLFKVLRKASPHNFTFTFDGEKGKKKGWIVAIGNCPQYGGGFKIAPQADPTDGFFDICFIEDIAKWRVLYYLPFVAKGLHGKFLKRVQFYRAKEVIVESSNTYIHLDGEIFKGDKFHFTLLPKRLKVIVPD